MALKAFNDRQLPLKEAEFDEEYAQLENAQYEYDESPELNISVPEAYYESEYETTVVRCCGGGVCVLLGVLTLTWIIHAIPVATITDIPPFARSMLWMSLAHHTDAWRQSQGALSPPPPAFGDGLGHFPDTQR